MITIPTTPDFADYVEVVSLGGTTFRLRFVFNSRDESWYMTILGAGGEELVAGIRVRTEWPINRQYVGEDLPQGVVIPADATGAKAEPGREDLQDDRIPLVFVAADEIAALIAGA